MGIHVFNPPDPTSHESSRCGNCRAGVAPYFKITLDYLGAEGDIPAGTLFLERTTAKINGTQRLAVWSPWSPQDQYPDDDFKTRWRLQYQPTPTGVGWDYWAIWVPDSSAFSNDYDAFYTPSPTAAQAAAYGVDAARAGHFACFGSTRFYFLDSPLALDWPDSVLVEAWYP